MSAPPERRVAGRDPRYPRRPVRASAHGTRAARDMTTHGTKSAYNRGCRCDACREASRQARARQRQTARERETEPTVDDPAAQVARSEEQPPAVPEPRPAQPFAQPAAQEPKVLEPKGQELALHEPKVQEPKLEEPKVQEPAVQEPRVEEPAVQEPARQIAQPWTQRPVVEPRPTESEAPRPIPEPAAAELPGPARARFDLLESTVTSSADVWHEISKRLVRAQQHPAKLAPIASDVSSAVSRSLREAETAWSSGLGRHPRASGAQPGASSSWSAGPSSAAREAGERTAAPQGRSPISPSPGSSGPRSGATAGRGQSNGPGPERQGSGQPPKRSLFAGLRRIGASRSRPARPQLPPAPAPATAQRAAPPPPTRGLPPPPTAAPPSSLARYFPPRPPAQPVEEPEATDDTET